MFNSLTFFSNNLYSLLYKNYTAEFIPLASISFMQSIKSSISLGVTIKLKLLSFILVTNSFSEILKSHNFKVSNTIVAASKTVGTPIPITGTPKVSFESSSCLFPTPPPGTIPVSEICIDLLILSIFFEHKLSIAITKPGFTLSSIPLTTSIVSIPVVPRTPWNYCTYCSNIFINSIWYIFFYMSCNFYIFYNLCT